MSLTIFDNKPLVQINGETISDLTYPSVRYNYEPVIIGAIVVNEYLAIRPDLISRSAYGTTEYWDFILKYNGISNPYSIGPNDKLLIPSLESMSEQITPSGTRNAVADAVRKQYIDVSKKAKVDPKLAVLEKKRREAQRQKAKGIGVSSASNLPPNIAEIGDSEIIIKGGKVFFGPDIARSQNYE